MQAKQKRLLGLVVVLALGVAVVWIIRWSLDRAGRKPAGPPVPRRHVENGSRPSEDTGTTRPVATTSATAWQPPLPAPESLNTEEAVKAFSRGLDAQKAGRLLEARGELARALFSESLNESLADQARKTLTELANATLFSRAVQKDDPYTGHYRFQAGESLAGVAGVIRQHALRVPESLILQVNGLARAEDIQAGLEYKIVRGPFHAVVHKGRFVMDLFLQREGQPRVFVARVPVGLGRNGSTPTGWWRVALDGKQVKATWYPPPNSPVHKTEVPYTDPDYAFGPKGLWIGLEGIEPNTAGQDHYGIHSTNDESSVGKASSLGCIRLKDKDIDLAFSLLYPVHSYVQVRD